MKASSILKEVGLFLILVILCIVVTILNPRFLSSINIQNTLNLIGLYGIFSLGVALPIITGGIDLSIGSVLAFLGVILSLALGAWGWPIWASVGAVLVCGSCLGAFHGILITKVKLQPFVVTLCGLMLYRGLTRYIANDETKGFTEGQAAPALSKLVTGSTFNYPNSFVFLILLSIVLWVLLHRSVYGRHLFALGKNEEAARYAGVNVKLMTMSAYIICCLLVAVASIFMAFYTNSISPSTHGNSYELYAIAAAVLGGCSLRGGEGSVPGILIGTALLQVLQNLVNLLGIPSALNFAVSGVAILIGVIADQALSGKGKQQSV